MICAFRKRAAVFAGALLALLFILTSTSTAFGDNPETPLEGFCCSSNMGASYAIDQAALLSESSLDTSSYEIEAVDVCDEKITLTGTDYYTKANEVLLLINRERMSVGLSSLAMDSRLSEAAMQRAAEIALHFSHTRPNGSIWSSVAAAAGGENIAAGVATSKEVMNHWMNSPGHKANILKNSWQSVGVGCFSQGGATFWVQIFSNQKTTGSVFRANMSASHTIEVSYKICGCEQGFNLNYSNESLRTLDYGTTFKLSYDICNKGWSVAYCKVDPSNVTWSSSNSSVCTVNSNGVVKAVGSGEAVITAKLPSGKSLTQTFKIINQYQMGTFKDVDEEIERADDGVWYVDDGWLSYVVSRNIMSGYLGSNNFGPYHSVTRGQVAVILHRAQTGVTATTVNNNVSTVFDDVKPGDYYTAAIAWANANSIVTGYSDTGLFKPDNEVTREELATMIARYTKTFGGKKIADTSSSKFYSLSGSENVSSWAKESFIWCVDQGIIGGFEGKYLNPKHCATRSEMAKIITVTLRDVIKLWI